MLDNTFLFYSKDINDCVQIYRTIHRNPEIGLEEFETSKYIRRILSAIDGVEVQQPLNELPTAIIATIKVNKPSKIILLRSELDALNFPQQSGLPHCSTNGLHHACGHDAHMASLITAVKIAARNRVNLDRNIIFCFQPGQEGKAGASKLFKARPNILNGVDQCYAQHFNNSAPPGTIFLGKGPVTALTAALTIQIQGRSAHCMTPNAGIDANFIGCTLVTQLYSLIGMKIPPLEGASLVIYSVKGGDIVTKVSNKFELKGSVRVTSMESFYKLENVIRDLAIGLCKAFGASQPSISLKTGSYRPVINDEKLMLSTRKKIQCHIPEIIIDENQKSFAGEDFCQFSQRKPSCYIGVGAALPDSIDNLTKESKYPLHSPQHKFDEEVFATSVKLWEAIMFK